MADGFPERIVSLSPSCTEILFAVGAGPKVVGVTDYCNYPSELEARIGSKEVTTIGGYWDPSVETIVDLKPDLVLVSTAQCRVKTNKCKTSCSRRCELTIKAANELKSCGLNVLILAPHSMNDVLGDILSVGKATGNVDKAGNLVDDLKQRINRALEQSKTVSARPSVYFEVWNEPYMSAGSGTWIGNLIDLAGGTNIFGSSVSEWPIIEASDIIQLNPAVMVFPVIPGVPRFWGSFEAVKKRSGWDAISAVRNNNLFEVPRDFISRPGPRLVYALELLTEMVQKSLNTS